MKFNNLNDIKEYLLDNGFFYTKNGATLKPHIKVGESVEDIKELLPVHEIRLNEIIQSAVVNPLVNMDDVKLRKLSPIIDFEIIKKYNQRENKIKTLEKNSKLLKGSKTFAYCKEERKYFKIQNSRFKNKGIYALDFELIPEGEEIHSFNNYNSLKSAYEYNGMDNNYSEEYDRQISIFNDIRICNW